MSNPKEVQLWGDRLRDAKLQLDFARIYVKEVERDFPAEEVPTPASNFAHHRALRHENLALAEYNRILRIYTCLVLDGEVPEKRTGQGATQLMPAAVKTTPNSLPKCGEGGGMADEKPAADRSD